MDFSLDYLKGIVFDLFFMFPQISFEFVFLIQDVLC